MTVVKFELMNFKVLAISSYMNIVMPLPPPQAFRVSRKAGETGELEARETGDERERRLGTRQVLPSMN